jgi:hypothetical protein
MTICCNVYWKIIGFHDRPTQICQQIYKLNVTAKISFTLETVTPTGNVQFILTLFDQFARELCSLLQPQNQTDRNFCF